MNEGSPSVKSQEIPSAREQVSRGNNIHTDLVTTQPQLDVDPATQASPEAAGLTKPGCCASPHLTVLDLALQPVSSGVKQQRHSSMPVPSGVMGRSKRSGLVSSHRPPATTSDLCVHLVLVCLWCQCSVLLRGLLEGCSSCLNALCTCCCNCCTRCCSAIQDAHVEPLNCHAHCHSVMFESCCEPTECLEFCLECCNICHHS
ncbi:myoD family inhibitor domain-containing protein-like [Thalassophryne amazonica]|uniref:myoD family inhibitor domain-containing protein-like n=1 Tax=Thalassophryne amazonica TaxID=390379 RepID=UPI0014717353|nr:myoD family inhibitor domain-containing protein-like [Thalassophryne amazonica]